MWWGTGFWVIVPAIGMAICTVLMVAMAFFGPGFWRRGIDETSRRYLRRTKAGRKTLGASTAGGRWQPFG